MFASRELTTDGLATVKQASIFLSVGRSTIYQLMDSGELPYCKIGRARRVPWLAIHKLVADSLRGDLPTI